MNEKEVEYTMEDWPVIQSEITVDRPVVKSLTPQVPLRKPQSYSNHSKDTNYGTMGWVWAIWLTVGFSVYRGLTGN